MSTFDRPQSLPEWCLNNPSNCTDPPQQLTDAGFTQGSVPVAEYENAYRRNLGLWLGYLDQATTKQVLTSALNLDLRLIGGGNFTYTVSSNTLAWDAPLYLSVPGLAQSSNAIAAGSVVLGQGTLAYVAANIPFSTKGDTTSGDAAVDNVVTTSAIAVGQSVTGPGIANGTTVASISGSTVTLSQPATATASQVTLTFVSSGALTVQSTTTQSFTPGPNSVVVAFGLADAAVVGVNSGQMMVRALESRRLLGAGFASTFPAIAGQALTQGQACFLSNGASGLTAGAAYLSDASSGNGPVRGKFAGFANLTAAQGASSYLISNGIIGGFTGLSVGAVYYIDPANPGAITATKPTTAGQYVIPVGSAVSTTQLQIIPSANALAAPVVGARQKLQAEIGTATTVSANSGSSVLRSYFDTKTGGLAYSIYQFAPTFPGSILSIDMVSSGLNQSGFGQGTFTMQVYQTPNYVNAGRTAGYVYQSSSPTTYVGNSQGTILSWQPPANQVPLYTDCTYSFTVSTSYSNQNGSSIYHHVRMTYDQPG